MSGGLIFLRETDTLVEFSAEGRVRIDTLAPGRFRVRLTGENDGEYAVRVVTVRFLLPDGWRYEGTDADCRLEAGGRILVVCLVSLRSETVSRTIPLLVR